MYTFLHCFSANGKFYGHWIDTVTDATFITDEEDGPEGKRVFTVDASGVVSDLNGQYIGCFRLDKTWNFYPKGTKSEPMTTDRTIDHVEGLLEAERIIFKLILECVAEAA